MPEGAVYVGRGSRWGNDFRVDSNTTPAEAVDLYTDMIQRWGKQTADSKLLHDGLGVWDGQIYANIRQHLAGKDLACWCPLDQPCHADVLLKLADPTDVLTAALADTEGQALVQAILDRKTTP